MTAFQTRETSILVAQGEFEVAAGPDVVLSTLLGSCVAACIWDPEYGIGGMNHIVLPDATLDDQQRTFVGVNAMELLINGIIKTGGRRDRLQAKLFGGASMIAGLSNVGLRNAEFAAGFLEREGIPCVSTSLGGENGRRIKFWPATGRAQQKIMPKDSLLSEASLPTMMPQFASNAIELF